MKNQDKTLILVSVLVIGLIALVIVQHQVHQKEFAQLSDKVDNLENKISTESTITVAVTPKLEKREISYAYNAENSTELPA
jgi:hypothetical protein